ncbi:MAG: GNAT family N-acetyltransferase [Thermoplasmatales archaeon]|nr:MAG: GNAT family N-acetyltransferase [Thermoplasmatales archaeon]
MIKEIYEEDLINVKYLIDEVSDFAYKSLIPKEGYEYLKNNLWGLDVLKKDAKEGYTIVVKDDDKIIGTGTIVGDYISKVYIKPEYHGRGLGKLIVKWLEDKAKSNGVKTIFLASNVYAEKFYTKLGYTTTENREMSTPNGYVFKLSWMKKDT